MLRTFFKNLLIAIAIICTMSFTVIAFAKKTVQGTGQQTPPNGPTGHTGRTDTTHYRKSTDHKTQRDTSARMGHDTYDDKNPPNNNKKQ